MANTARLAERLIGLFCYFVENGSTVDGQTVSELIVPDASPTSNWLSVGAVLEGAAWENDEQDDSAMIPVASGGFRRRNRKNVIEDRLRFQTREMSGLVDRLQMGLSSAIVEGTPQSPHAASDRYIRGWLLIHGRQVGGNGTGTDDFRYLGWVDLRLAEQPKYENKVLSPVLMAHEIVNALNSVNYPAAA